MNNKLIEQSPRTASDIQQDVALFLQQNIGLYSDWIALAKAKPIDDRGALAGNNVQKAARVAKQA